MNEIIIYQTIDKQTQVEVAFENDTVWLTQQQMSHLFKQTKQNISLHINNIFKEKELSRILVVKESLTTASDGKKYKTQYFNLDVIISVGYRVKSQQGTQFRQWATQRLKDYLVTGYSLNEKRLNQVLQNMQQLEKAVSLIQNSAKTENLQLQEAKGLLDILSLYTKSFVLLNQYDSHSLPTNNLNENITYEIQYNEAIAAIAELKKQLMAKKEAAELFGNEKDSGFKS
ncbi:MAG TPA: RhuM family protein [Hanamia sp.]|nr:RhuM family protein [Hanamia sp.]